MAKFLFFAVWGGFGGPENSEIGFSPLFPSLPAAPSCREALVDKHCEIATPKTNLEFISMFIRGKHLWKV